MKSLVFCYGSLGRLIHMASGNEETVEHWRKALQIALKVLTWLYLPNIHHKFLRSGIQM